MKRITVILVALVAIGFTGLQAQSSANMKKHCGSKSATVAQKSCHGATSAAVQLASIDETIETRKCAETGKVSFVRKKECPVSGTISYANVSYDTGLGKFVNMSPSGVKACCTKDAATGCCSKATNGSASAVKTSLEAGSVKSCSARMKAHCAQKSSSKVADVDEVKPVRVRKGS